MKQRISFILSIVAVVLLVCCMFVYLTEDRVAPELMIPETKISYREGEDKSVLLDDVTAWDNRDGDLSDNVRIYSIAVLNSGNQAVVTYAVYDEAANMTKKTRTVGYRK